GILILRTIDLAIHTYSITPHASIYIHSALGRNHDKQLLAKERLLCLREVMNKGFQVNSISGSRGALSVLVKALGEILNTNFGGYDKRII
ncbi:MAG: hypothetical protein M3298_07370, partial [Thermoproteota archaeon]|nr:hypothetical protein [Thermoproteota archaeon]MDQ3807971.1 hypothetical protein [Thermoproteota archaeon]